MNRIAIIFDFDDTLAPDSTSSFLATLGVNTVDFWNNKVQSLMDKNWDPVPAYLYLMIEESKSGKPITKEKLSQFGKQIKFHEGVSRLFNHLKEETKLINPQIELEFFIISSGIGEIIRNTSIAKHFSHIWGCDFHYDKKGQILFPKNVVSFTDKTRYIFQISKGLFGKNSNSNPFEVNKRVPDDKIHLTLDQMIYIGDGYTDIPCFSLIKGNDGISFGVYNKENRKKFGRAWGFIEEGRVSNLHSTDFRKGSDLCNSIEMAIESICKRIELKSNTYQG